MFRFLTVRPIVFLRTLMGLPKSLEKVDPEEGERL
jgi:hypothetical protein